MDSEVEQLMGCLVMAAIDICQHVHKADVQQLRQSHLAPCSLKGGRGDTYQPKPLQFTMDLLCMTGFNCVSLRAIVEG